MRESFFLCLLLFLSLAGEIAPEDAASGQKAAPAAPDAAATASKAAPDKPKIKIPKPKTPKTIIDEVTDKELEGVLDEHEHTAVLFYSKMNGDTEAIISAMEQIDLSTQDLVVVR